MVVCSERGLGQDSNRVPWVHISRNLGKHPFGSVGENPRMILSASDLETETLPPARRPMSSAFYASTSSAMVYRLFIYPQYRVPENLTRKGKRG